MKKVIVIDNKTKQALSDAELDVRFRDAVNKSYPPIVLLGEYKMEPAEALFMLSKKEYERQKRGWVINMVDDTGEFSIEVA